MHVPQGCRKSPFPQSSSARDKRSPGLGARAGQREGWQAARLPPPTLWADLPGRPTPGSGQREWCGGLSWRHTTAELGGAAIPHLPLPEEQTEAQRGMHSWSTAELREGPCARPPTGVFGTWFLVRSLPVDPDSEAGGAQVRQARCRSAWFPPSSPPEAWAGAFFPLSPGPSCVCLQV